MCRRDHDMTAGICPNCGLRSAMETDLLLCETGDNIFVENKGYCIHNRNPVYNLNRQIAPGGILPQPCRRCESEISWCNMMRAEDFKRWNDAFAAYAQNTPPTWPDYAWQNRPYDPEAFQAVLPRDTTHETDKDYIIDVECIYHAPLKQYQHRQLQEEQETRRSARPQNQLRASWPVLPYDHDSPGPVYEEDYDPGFAVRPPDFDDVVYWNPGVRPGPLTQVAEIEAQAQAQAAMATQQRTRQRTQSAHSTQRSYLTPKQKQQSPQSQQEQQSDTESPWGQAVFQAIDESLERGDLRGQEFQN